MLPKENKNFHFLSGFSSGKRSGEIDQPGRTSLPDSGELAACFVCFKDPHPMRGHELLDEQFLRITNNREYFKKHGILQAPFLQPDRLEPVDPQGTFHRPQADWGVIACLQYWQTQLPLESGRMNRVAP